MADTAAATVLTAAAAVMAGEGNVCYDVKAYYKYHMGYCSRKTYSHNMSATVARIMTTAVDLLGSYHPTHDSAEYFR